MEEDIKVLEKYLKETDNECLEGFYDSYCITSIEKQAIENLIKAYKKERNKSKIYEQQYNNLLKDFEAYKNDKDINYLDGIHHKKLIEKSIGQFIDKPEECWFDKNEIKILIDDTICEVDSKKDFITLKNISDTKPYSLITVIAESPLSGAIYRYNNYGKKEWQLIGTMLGYA